MKIFEKFMINYLLFNKKIINDRDVIMLLPINSFGFYVEIIRSKSLPEYPFNVHGCKGYIDKDFNTLLKIELYKKILETSFNALYDDNRNKYFESITTDLDSMLIISFMLKPLYKINKNGIIIELNTLFNNNDFYIIIQDKKNKFNRDIFIPNTFQNSSWNNILEYIKLKVNIIDDEYELFAFKLLKINTNFRLN